MFVKIGKYISSSDAVAVYCYEICDKNGTIQKRPTNDFLNQVYKQSNEDAQILKSQLIDMTKYGLLGRKEISTDREGLYALPDKYQEGRGKITSRYRLFFWILNGTTILIGGGCFKPEKDASGKPIKAYQEVQDCEDAADELSLVGKCIERLETLGEAIIEIKLIELEEDIIKI